jgi:uncharacterized protein (TIGR02118 family)
VVKIVALIRRRADLSPEEFRTYYEQRHAPLFARVIPPSVDRAITHYVQNHAVILGAGSAAPAWDCVTEIGFDDLAAMRVWSDWYLSDEGAVLRDDELNFMDIDRRVVLVTEERHPVNR